MFSDGFENDLKLWTPAKEHHSQYFKIYDSDSNEGKKHLKLQDNIDSETVHIISKSFDAVADTVYTVKYDAKIDEGKGLKIYIQFKDSQGKTLYSKSMYASGNAWKTFSHEHTSPAVIINGRFLVPLRFVSEAFGAQVGWADATQTAIINFESGVVTGRFDNIVRPVKQKIENALEVKSSMQSGGDGSGNDIAMVFDGSFGSRWAFKASGDKDGYGIFDLGSVKELDSIYLGFYNANTREYKFSFFVSFDNKTYTPVKENVVSTVKTTELEKFDLGKVEGRYLKIVGHGNSQNEWNNITEMIIVGK